MHPMCHLYIDMTNVLTIMLPICPLDIVSDLMTNVRNAPDMSFIHCLYMTNIGLVFFPSAMSRAFQHNGGTIKAPPLNHVGTMLPG